jgi:hypothetical protein
MKKQIAKSLSILSLFTLFSMGAVNVFASGGTCSVPSCRPRVNIAAPASEPDLAKLTEPVRYEPEVEFSEPPEDFFSFGYFLAQWALNFLR